MAASLPREPVALTIAGSDSSGGAGIQADLKTFTALGVYGASVVTALTAQNTTGVAAVAPVGADFIAAQVRAVANDLDIRASKTGMLGDRATVEAVAAAIARHRLAPVVVDPVMVATSGDPLLAVDAVEAVRIKLLPLAALATPNLDEAARLLDQPRAPTLEAVEAQARAILAFGPEAVLVKGGHGVGDTSVDVLVTRGGAPRHYAAPRIETPNTHGTGCTLSAAITALLAVGIPLDDAVRRAKAFVWQALASGADRVVGSGSGPVDHLFQIRRTPTPV
jgi:hydroxymethylpyrimidine/phosphomethylpyrimidine kinase